MDERDWEEFKAKLKRKTEIDLDLYKAPQMQRRIMNLARRNGYDKYSAYFGGTNISGFYTGISGGNAGSGSLAGLAYRQCSHVLVSLVLW